MRRRLPPSAYFHLPRYWNPWTKDSLRKIQFPDGLRLKRSMSLRNSVNNHAMKNTSRRIRPLHRESALKAPQIHEVDKHSGNETAVRRMEEGGPRQSCSVLLPLTRLRIRIYPSRFACILTNNVRFLLHCESDRYIRTICLVIHTTIVFE